MPDINHHSFQPNEEPEDDIERTDRQYPGYADLLSKFHILSEQQYGAIVDIDPDDEPRTSIFEYMLAATSPTSRVTDEHGPFSGVLSDGRTDFNGRPFAIMSYVTEEIDKRSVLPIHSTKFFLPTGHEQANLQELEIVKGRAAIVAVFRDEHTRVPEICLLMDGNAFSNSLAVLERAAQRIERLRDEKPFVSIHDMTSVLGGLVLQQAYLENDRRQIDTFFEKFGSEPEDLLLESPPQPGPRQELILAGIESLSPPNARTMVDCCIVIGIWEQQPSGMYIPTDGWKRQEHRFQIMRDSNTGLVSVEAVEPFRELPFSIAS